MTVCVSFLTSKQHLPSIPYWSSCPLNLRNPRTHFRASTASLIGSLRTNHAAPLLQLQLIDLISKPTIAPPTSSLRASYHPAFIRASGRRPIAVACCIRGTWGKGKLSKPRPLHCGMPHDPIWPPCLLPLPSLWYRSTNCLRLPSLYYLLRWLASPHIPLTIPTRPFPRASPTFLAPCSHPDPSIHASSTSRTLEIATDSPSLSTHAVTISYSWPPAFDEL